MMHDWQRFKINRMVRDPWCIRFCKICGLKQRKNARSMNWKNQINGSALEAAFLTHKSCQICSLDNLVGNYIKIESPVVKLPDGTTQTILSRKFDSIKEVQDELSSSDKLFYVYQLCEFDQYGIDLQKTGKKIYSLRYFIQKR